MIRLILASLVVMLGAGPQDPSRIADLVRKLDSADWVEQAQAAKGLAAIGKPALEPLAGVLRTESESGRYWASVVSQTILRNSGASAALPPSDPEPPPSTNPAGFSPGANDMGSLVFICNNSAHEPYEVVFSRCLTCGKAKRFAYDYGLDGYRCAVCKKVYAKKDLRCDKCGQPPAPRMSVRMKSHG